MVDTFFIFVVPSADNSLFPKFKNNIYVKKEKQE